VLLSVQCSLIQYGGFNTKNKKLMLKLGNCDAEKEEFGGTTVRIGRNNRRFCFGVAGSFQLAKNMLVQT